MGVCAVSCRFVSIYKCDFDSMVMSFKSSARSSVTRKYFNWISHNVFFLEFTIWSIDWASVFKFGPRKMLWVGRVMDFVYSITYLTQRHELQLWPLKQPLSLHPPSIDSIWKMYLPCLLCNRLEYEWKKKLNIRHFKLDFLSVIKMPIDDEFLKLVVIKMFL